MDKPFGLWVAEYSRPQDCFHVEPLARALETNRRIVAGRIVGADYVPFALCQSHEEAHRACNEMRALQQQHTFGLTAETAPEKRRRQLANLRHGGRKRTA